MTHAALPSCRWPLLAAVFLLGGCAAQPPAPMPAGAALVAAEVALARADYALAARSYAAAAGSEPALAERALRIAFEHGQYRELVALARAWLRRDPRSEPARRFLAVGLLELDQRGAAADALAPLIQSGYPSPADAFSALGESLTQLHNDAGVAHVVARLAARYPDLPEAALTVASLALAADDSPTALASATRALALRPGWRAARAVTARAYIAGGDCAQGLHESGVLAADADDTDRLTNAWLLSACDRGAEARAAFSDLLSSRVVRPEALDGLASLDIDARRYDDATMRLSELLATGRHGERAMYGLGLVADRRGDYARAVMLYARVQTGTRAVPAQLRAYRLGLEHGDAAIAAHQLDEFVAATPESRVEATAGRAQILADVGRRPEALALLARAIATYPDRMDLHYARATVLEQAGRIDEALAELRSVARSRPDDPVALNALGYTLADHGRALGAAEAMIRRALAERPDSAAVADSLGWVLHRRGRDSDALVALQHAYRLEQDGEIAVHLADVQAALGDAAAAAATLRGALARAPDDTRLQRAQSRHPDPAP